MASIITIPLTIASDLVYLISKWTIGNVYTGTKYLILGTPKSPEMIKLEELENKLNHKDTPDLMYYWDIKDKYSIGKWLIIYHQTVIVISDTKSEALREVAQLLDDNFPSNGILLIQIGNESQLSNI